MTQVVYVVEMLRNDTREEHSYIAGVYESEALAIAEATEHIDLRAKKYGAEITGYAIGPTQASGGDKVSWRKLSAWGPILTEKNPPQPADEKSEK